MTIQPERLGWSKYASKRTTPENFWARVDKSGACWLWEGRSDEKGYGRVGYDRKRNVGAHRVAWALTHGGDLPTAWVLHRCDNPPCVRPEHLFLGDARDNNRDRQNKGRTQGWAEMRSMRAGGATQQAIADRFGVSRGYVANIVSGALSRYAKGGIR
jgi:hypothetical protein